MSALSITRVNAKLNTRQKVKSKLCIRRVRESRGELRKFMRQVKKQNPAANVVLQYDKLFVNHRQGPCPGFSRAVGS